jgi:hypothetical protein
MILKNNRSVPHFLSALKTLMIPHEIVEQPIEAKFLVPPLRFAKKFGHKQVEVKQKIYVMAVKIGDDVWPLKRSANDVGDQKKTVNKDFQVMLNAIIASQGVSDE